MLNNLPVSAPCEVSRVGEIGPGGAFHTYLIITREQLGKASSAHLIQFQRGPRNEPDSTPGLFEDGLAAVLQDRLECFQRGQYACDENAAALEAIQAYREALRSRTNRRASEGTLGTTRGT